ncbi:MAG: ankyrin repeat domain-containing protein [Myxococcota bacterium]
MEWKTLAHEAQAPVRSTSPAPDARQQCLGAAPHAVTHNLTDAVALLLAAGARLDGLGERGKGPHNSAERCIAYHKDDALQTLTLLLDAGLDPNLSGPSGRPLLDDALRGDAWRIFRRLLERGAQLDQYGIEWSSQGSTLHAFLNTQRDKLDVDRLQWLIAQGASTNAANHNGQTPLFAMVRSLAPHASLLLDAGAHLNHHDHSGRTALHHAIRIGSDLAHVRALLDLNPDPNTIDHEGHTPLWSAVDRQDLPIVRALLDVGADPDLGTSVRELATERNLVLILELLGDATDTPDWLALILELIQSGQSLRIGSERFERGMAYQGVVSLVHHHTAWSNPRSSTRTRHPDWVLERLMWLAHTRPEPLHRFLTREHPDSRLPSTPEALRDQLRDAHPDLHARATHPISLTDVVRAVLTGIGSGAWIGSSDKEGARGWSRDGDGFRFAEEPYGHTQFYTRSEAFDYWGSLARIVDGIPVMNSEAGCLEPLMVAIGHLKHPTLRAWLQHSEANHV